MSLLVLTTTYICMMTLILWLSVTRELHRGRKGDHVQPHVLVPTGMGCRTYTRCFGCPDSVELGTTGTLRTCEQGRTSGTRRTDWTRHRRTGRTFDRFLPKELPDKNGLFQRPLQTASEDSV
ncbi:hypothetical protein BS17DRAFT_532361 [Gyrodon lividus]|nr:hypothetical protein BS17DRAFT_532361 [Gyrodon lividus]